MSDGLGVHHEKGSVLFLSIFNITSLPVVVCMSFERATSDCVSSANTYYRMYMMARLSQVGRWLTILAVTGRSRA